MYDKKISVITVVRNDREHIEKTIKSVLHQTYKNLEYIVLDGKSTDGTWEIIKQYQEEIDYMESAPDKGIYDAMNNAIKIATGEWIIFMNSGDSFYEKDTISKAFKNYQDNGEALVYGDFILFNKKGCEDHHVKAIAETSKVVEVAPSFHQAIFNKTSEMKAHPFELKYRIIADFAFFYDLYKRNSKRYYTNTTICNYDGSGLSATDRKRLVKENVIFFTSRREYKKAIFYLMIYIKRCILG